MPYGPSYYSRLMVSYVYRHGWIKLPEALINHYISAGPRRSPIDCCYYMLVSY
jgi:hypothetical protein